MVACKFCGMPNLHWVAGIVPATNTNKSGSALFNGDGQRHQCSAKSPSDQLHWDNPSAGGSGGGIQITPSDDWQRRITDAVTASQTAQQTALAVTSEFGKLGQQFNTVRGSLETVVSANAASMEDAIAKLQQEFDNLDAKWTEKLAKAVPVVIKHHDVEYQATHQLHERFPSLVKRVLQVHGQGIVFLIGEPGSMKTSVVPDLATALGGEDFPYYVVSANNQMSRAELMGFMNGHGGFTDSPIYKVVKDGGLLLLDEIDAGNANVLTGLNVAATNAFVGFANGETVQKHERCYIIAAGNTIGNGATPEFAGRNQMDLATRTRFVYFKWDTDWGLVASIVESRLGSDKWVRKVKMLHDVVAKHSFKWVVTSRVALIGADMIVGGESEETVLDEMVWMNLSEDERRTVETEMERLGSPVKTDMTVMFMLKSLSVEQIVMVRKANGFGIGQAIQQVREFFPGVALVTARDAVKEICGVSTGVVAGKTLSDSHLSTLRAIHADQGKISAIQWIRTTFSLDLKVAKDTVEWYCE